MKSHLTILLVILLIQIVNGIGDTNLEDDDNSDNGDFNIELTSEFNEEFGPIKAGDMTPAEVADKLFDSASVAKTEQEVKKANAEAFHRPPDSIKEFISETISTNETPKKLSNINTPLVSRYSGDVLETYMTNTSLLHVSSKQAMYIRVVNELNDIHEEFQRDDHITSDMQFTGLFIMEEIRRQANYFLFVDRSVSIVSTPSSKPTEIPAKTPTKTSMKTSTEATKVPTKATTKAPKHIKTPTLGPTPSATKQRTEQPKPTERPRFKPKPHLSRIKENETKEVLNEIEKLKNRLKNRLSDHILLISSERQKCSDLSNNYLNLIKRLNEAMDALKSSIQTWKSEFDVNFNNSQISEATVKELMGTIRKLYDLRRNDRQVYRYNTAKRRRSNNTINMAISLLCGLNNFKSDDLCNGVMNANDLAMEHYGTENALKIFFKDLSTLKNESLLKSLLIAKEYITTNGKDVIDADFHYLLNLLYKLKNKSDKLQDNDTKRLADNIDSYAYQERNVIISVQENVSLQQSLNGINETLKSDFSRANVQLTQYLTDLKRTQDSLNNNTNKCEEQEVNFAATFVGLEKQLDIVYRLMSIFRSMYDLTEPECKDLNYCNGDHGQCIFAKHYGSESICVCGDKYSGKSCELYRCPTEKKNLYIESKFAEWICSGRGKCDSANGECTCNKSEDAKESIYHGVNLGCEKKTCPKFEDETCGGRDRSLGCHTFHGKCKCRSGYRGDNCSFEECQFGCGSFSHGTCIGNGKCICNIGYKGRKCSEKTCPNGCGDSTQGQCVEEGPNAGTCACNQGYFGETCSKHTCPTNCSGNGICDISIGECICHEGYTSSPNCGVDSFKIDYGKVNIGSGYVRKAKHSNTQVGNYINFSKLMCDEPIVIVSIEGGYKKISDDRFIPDTFSISSYNISSKGFWVNIARVDAFNDYIIDGYKHSWGQNLHVNYAAYCSLEKSNTEKVGRIFVGPFKYNDEENIPNVKKMIKVNVEEGSFESTEIKWVMSAEYKGISREVLQLTHYGRQADSTFVNITKVSPCAHGPSKDKFNLGRCGWNQSFYIHYYASSGLNSYQPEQHKAINAPSTWFGSGQLGNGISFKSDNGTPGFYHNTRVLNYRCNFKDCQRPDIQCEKKWREWNECINKSPSCSLQDKGGNLIGRTCENSCEKTFSRYEYSCNEVIINKKQVKVCEWFNLYSRENCQKLCSYPRSQAINMVKCKCPIPDASTTCEDEIEYKDISFIDFDASFTELNCDRERIILRTSIRSQGRYVDTFAHTTYGLSASGFFVNLTRVDNCHGNRSRGPFPCTGWTQRPYVEYHVTCLPSKK